MKTVNEVVEYYREGELVETRTVVVPEVLPGVDVLQRRIDDLTARLSATPTTESVATLADAVDAALDPAATPARKQTLRDRLRDIIDRAADATPGNGRST